MEHEHANAFDPTCLACIVWASRTEDSPVGLDRPRDLAVTNIHRAGRVSPRSSRIIGIRSWEHDPSCRCRRCWPLDVRFAGWLWHQLWGWTPAGQGIYWALALLMTHFYS